MSDDTPDTETTPDPDDEPVQPEVVKAQLAVRDPRNDAIEAAAQAAVELPGVPGRDEFLALAMQARMLCMSGAAPKAVRNNPYVAFHIAMVGRDLGISPSAALELIDVIDGRNGPQLSLSPQLMNGQIRRLGLGEIVKGHSDAASCTAIAIGPGGRDRRCRLQWPEHVEDCSCDVLGHLTFTWEDAQMAGLVGPNCKPGAHVKDQQRSSNGRSWKVCGCNQGYIAYPQRMHWWRASGYLADDTFPEAGLGLYSPEELGAVIDDQGRPIDPATVALPEGYDEPQRSAKEQAAAAAEAPADPAELWRLQVRIRALPEKLRDDLRTAWNGNESRVKGQRPAALPQRLLRVATSMVNAYEAQARSAQVDLAAEQIAVRREVAWAHLNAAIWAPGRPGKPSDSPENVPAPETPEAASKGSESDQGAAEDERDWSQAMQNVSAVVRELGAKLPNETITAMVELIKGMHHKTLDKALSEAGIPTDGPIDLRRMHLAAHWMRRDIAEAEGVPFGKCEHDAADGFCTVVGCPHAEEPF